MPRLPPGEVPDDFAVHPPVAVARAAEEGLEVRASVAPSRRGGTAVGLSRGRQLSGREPVSVGTVKRMLRYFSRHLIDRAGSTWSERGAGWQAWHLWGGDPGVRWALAVVRRADPAYYRRLIDTETGYKLKKL